MILSAPDPGNSWVVAEGLGLRIGEHALLDDVSLELSAGSLVALVGPNGAGKSTLLGLISGDLEPTSGSLLVGGRAPRAWKAKEMARVRSVLGQKHEASFAFTVEEVVAMGRVPHPVSDLDDDIVQAALSDGDVAQLAARDTTTLSGGELSRTMFARVLAQTARLVLLDEPTAALDLRHQESVLTVAARLAREGCCVVVVLHDLNLAARHADRIVMFSHGRLVADGAPRDVLTAERIEQIYGQRVQLLEHPGTGATLVVPL